VTSYHCFVPCVKFTAFSISCEHHKVGSDEEGMRRHPRRDGLSKMIITPLVISYLCLHQFILTEIFKIATRSRPFMMMPWTWAAVQNGNGLLFGELIIKGNVSQVRFKRTGRLFPFLESTYTCVRKFVSTVDSSSFHGAARTHWLTNSLVNREVKFQSTALVTKLINHVLGHITNNSESIDVLDYRTPHRKMLQAGK